MFELAFHFISLFILAVVLELISFWWCVPYRLLAWKEIALGLRLGHAPLDVLVKVRTREYHPQFNFQYALRKINVRDLPIYLSIVRLKKLLDGGGSIGESAVFVKRLFPKRYLGYLVEGENLGAAPAGLGLMEGAYRRDVRYLRALVAILVYPYFLLILAQFSVVIVETFINPAYEAMGSAKFSVPMAARPLFLVALFVAVGLVFYPTFRKRGVLQWVYERAPVAGRLYHYWFWGDFFRALSRFLAEGAALPKAVSAAGHALGQARLARACDRMAAGAAEGAKLSELLGKESMFPECLVWTVAQGERDGRLVQGLARLAGRYESAMESQLPRALKFCEMIIIVALVLMLAAIMANSYMALMGFTGFFPE